MPISPSPSVARAGDVLHHLARHPTTRFSISELARELGVPRATCDSVLQALALGGFVTRDVDDLGYGLGPSCIAIGDAGRHANPALLATLARARELAQSLQACTAVSVRYGDESRVAEVFDFGPPFGARAQVGQSIPHVPPFGAVYVAWDEQEAAAWVTRAAVELGEANVERYRRALDEVRRRGYAVNGATSRRPELTEALTTLAGAPDQYEERRARDALATELMQAEYLATEIDDDAKLQINHMSAPVFDHTGRSVTSILLIGPSYEVSTTELRARGEELRRAATRAIADIGGCHPGLEPTDQTRTI